jgi:ComF family protein
VKFARDRSVAEELALELAALAQEAGFDSPQIIVPVPSASRHWRHFDVVHLVCEELSKQRNAPLLQVLARRPGRAPQIKLNQRQRTEGLDQYIYLTGSIPHGALVWLVDDVYTTGATVDACAGALLRAGARSVYVFVLGN